MSAPERTNWNTRVEVTLWDALMAVRYGAGRHTYANSDAASLAQKIWPLLDQVIRDQIRGDVARLTGLEVEPWAWLAEDEGVAFGKDDTPEGVGFGKTATLNDSKELTVEHSEGIRMTDAEFESFMRAAKGE